jgi:hypothetical protein
MQKQNSGEFLFVGALERITDSIDREANLTPEGRVVARNALAAALATQLNVQRNVERHPEIETLPIPGPVFIIGTTNAGISLVHNLLAQHPGVHAPRLWELMTPAGSDEPELHNGTNRNALARPDECHHLLVNTFQSMVFPLRYHVPSYVTWLARQDLVSAYRYHRVQLQNIHWRLPRGLLVLRCPFHAWGIGALARVYPEARFVFVHRRPAEVVPTICGLCAALRGALSESVDLVAIGSFWLRQLDRVLGRMESVRRQHLAGRSVLDVRYRELMADPLATASRICDFAGLPPTLLALERMRRYLAASPPDRLDVSHYTAEEFGLSSARIDDRFAQYRSAYGV